MVKQVNQFGNKNNSFEPKIDIKLDIEPDQGSYKIKEGINNIEREIRLLHLRNPYSLSANLTK